MGEFAGKAHLNSLMLLARNLATREAHELAKLMELEK